MMFQFELYFIDKEIVFLITVPGPKPGVYERTGFH